MHFFFVELKQEKTTEQKPPADWPRSGKVKFHNMSLRYDPQGPPTLKNLRLDIESGWKVGVSELLIKSFESLLN